MIYSYRIVIKCFFRREINFESEEKKSVENIKIVKMIKKGICFFHQISVFFFYEEEYIYVTDYHTIIRFLHTILFLSSTYSLRYNTIQYNYISISVK